MIDQPRRPFFTVIMNCHNGEKYLKRAIDSVFNQTHKDWEIIFVDNASVDNSRVIAESYSKKLKLHRLLKLLPFGHARKYAVGQATGMWITFLDVDDFWAVHKLEAQYNLLHESNFVACYGGYYLIDKDGNEFGVNVPRYDSGFIFGSQLLQFEVSTVTMALKMDSLIDNGILYNVELQSSPDDNVVLRLLAKGDCCVLKSPLAYYTVSENSLSVRSMNNWASDRFATAIQLKSENPYLESKFRVQFKEFIARGYYYQACSLVHSRNLKDARQALIEACRLRGSYYVFFLLSFFPYLWNFANQPRVKFLMTKIYLRVLATPQLFSKYLSISRKF
jgi:glycosyltransferase involved in cell wall biosynthesis